MAPKFGHRATFIICHDKLYGGGSRNNCRLCYTQQVSVCVVVDEYMSLWLNWKGTLDGLQIYWANQTETTKRHKYSQSDYRFPSFEP